MAILSKEIDCQLLCGYLQVRVCVTLWLLTGLTYFVYKEACYYYMMNLSNLDAYFVLFPNKNTVLC